jgi:hypothetical protein
MGASVALFQYGQAEIDHLTRRDRKLGRAIGRIGMIERPVMPDLFKALVPSSPSRSPEKPPIPCGAGGTPPSEASPSLLSLP